MNPMQILGMAQSFIGAGLLLSAKRPKYEIPAGFSEALDISQMQTQNDMPGMEQGLDLASLASANAINAAQGTGNAVSMLPAVVAQQNAQNNQLIAQNAAFRDSKMTQYMSMLEKKGNYEDMKWQMNKFAPYKDTVQQGLTMLGGGITNTMGGLDMSSVMKSASAGSDMASFEAMLNRMFLSESYEQNKFSYDPNNFSGTPMGNYNDTV